MAAGPQDYKRRRRPRMEKDLFTVIIGGKAGQGTTKAGMTAASLFSSMNRDIFQMNDYPSLIRGGHNFSVVSSSVGPIRSHYLTADLIVALDKRSYDAHRNHLAKDGIMVVNSDEIKEEGIGIPITTEAKIHSNPLLISGLASVAILAALIGITNQELENIIRREYARNIEENLAFSISIYDIAEKTIGKKFSLKKGMKKREC